ncbi:MAG: septal ring lytic transglycosylase RlpA family protein [Terracidiphilus sp.]|nr:septal ring lytic transglycosylase RlpA family protein [Terracidiphilus sp.]
MNLKTSLKIWITAVASSVALAAGMVTFSTVAVHADARLSRPADTLPPTSLVASPTPGDLAPEQASVKQGDRLHGLASWYGGVFNGRKTASGERFDMHAMTACHPTLPFGSLVRVVNKANKRAVVVRITDRGDLVDEGRIIDLSYGAAQKLAMTRIGLAKVDLVVLSLGGERGKR